MKDIKEFVEELHGWIATRDLKNLVSQDIFEQVGITGKGTNYILKTPERRQTIRVLEINTKSSQKEAK